MNSETNDVDNLNNLNYIDNQYSKSVKKMSYDDILSSLNLVVSKDGVLKYMKIKTETLDIHLENTQNIQNIQNTETSKIEPQVKNSYIYNKYFKNYKDKNICEKIPTSREEYIKMMKEHLINLQNKRMIQQKSKKLLFINNSKPIYTNTTTNHNFLFKF